MKKSIAVLSAFLLAAPFSAEAEEIFMEVDEGTNLREVLQIINEQPLPKETVEVIEWISVPAKEEDSKEAKTEDKDEYKDEYEYDDKDVNSEAKPQPKPFKPFCNVFDLAKRNHGQVKRIYKESTKKMDLKAEIAAEREAEFEAIANELRIADEKYEFIEK